MVPRADDEAAVQNLHSLVHQANDGPHELLRDLLEVRIKLAFLKLSKCKLYRAH